MESSLAAVAGATKGYLDWTARLAADLAHFQAAVPSALRIVTLFGSAAMP